MKTGYIYSLRNDDDPRSEVIDSKYEYLEECHEGHQSVLFDIIMGCPCCDLIERGSNLACNAENIGFERGMEAGENRVLEKMLVGDFVHLVRGEE